MADPHSKTSHRGAIVALVAAAMCCALLAALVLSKRRTAAEAPVATAPAAKCEVPALALPSGAGSASSPSIVLAGAPGLRFFLDGAAVLADPSAPSVVPAGEHQLRVEEPGGVALSTRFRVLPFEAGLFHAKRSPGAGLTLVRLGTICSSCGEALDVAKLDPSPSDSKPSALFVGAASALRTDDWRSAAEALAQVPPKLRGKDEFLRLSAAVYADSLGTRQARAALDQAAKQDPELKAALAAFDRAVAAEGERRVKLVVNRWNKVTDRFATFSQKYEPLARNPVAAASERMVGLTPAFEKGMEEKDPAAMEAATRSAEQTLLQLATLVRGLKPSDCPFQNEVAAALLQ